MGFKQFIKESKKGKEFLDFALPMNIRKTIKKRGGQIFQIGGAVRDSFVDKVSKDLDIIIVGLDLVDLEKILKNFGKVDAVGKSFGVLKFTPRHFKKGDEPIDVSVPRAEKNAKGKHKEVEIELGKHISLKQDQLRRDFWMNAIAQDIETGEVIDVDGKGQLDIKNKKIRMIRPEAFAEDGLRMLRAVQFASRFDFEIEPDTLKEIQRVAHTILKTVVPDRFVEEFKKLFHKSNKPSVGIKWLIETGLFKAMFSEDIKFSKKFLAVDNLKKDDFAGFMTILLLDVKDVDGAMEKIDPPNELFASVVGAVKFLRENDRSIDDVDLVLALSNLSTKGSANKLVPVTVENVTKAMGQPFDIEKRLAKMRSQGIPTSRTELSVKGNEVTVPKHQIADELNRLLRFAVTNKTNDKETLLQA